MVFRVALAVCLLAVASAQYYASAPKYAPAVPEPYDPNPTYEFAYAVNDPSTYDIKSQKEYRNGDYVKGVYELYEPDGTKRIVEYADEGYGFQAIVKKEGTPSYAAPKYAAPAYPAPKPYY